MTSGDIGRKDARRDKNKKSERGRSLVRSRSLVVLSILGRSAKSLD